jgi:hypothetical protein
LTISHLIILGIIATFSIGVDYAFAESSDTIITVQMNGPSTFYLDESNQIIRAAVEIQNYTPSDGIYFMKVTHIPTQRVLKNFDIYPKPSGNDLWSVQIAYPFLESDIKIGDQAFLGEFEIDIRTEFGSQTASTTFSIFEYTYGPESIPEITSTPELEPTLEPEPTPQSEPANSTTNKIPEWVKDIFLWYSQDQISEDEIISAIQYLVNEGIIKLK